MVEYKKIINNPYFLITVGVLSGVILVASYAYMHKYDSKQGFPCYCQACTQHLVNAANQGDQQAQQLLVNQQMNQQNSMLQSGDINDVEGTSLGPFGLLLGLAVIIIITRGIFLLIKKATPLGEKLFKHK
jgi:hypothetical protein